MDRVTSPGDPAMWLGKYIRDTVGNGFGLQVVSERPGDCHYRLTRCSLLENARSRGVAGQLAICEAHEEFWATVARSIAGGPSVRFAPTLRDGHFCCEVHLHGVDTPIDEGSTPKI